MSGWRDAHALLRQRADAAAELVRAGAQMTIPPLPFLPGSTHRFVTTGIGSSAAHATLLAHLLTELGLPARYASPGSFIAPPRYPQRSVLIVFSQGLSPNARLALAHAEAWAGVVLVTAWTGGDAMPAEKRAAIDRVERAGGVCITLPGGPEYGTLLRLGGPLAGYAVVHRLAAAMARSGGIDTSAVAIDADAVVARMGAARAAAASMPANAVDGPLALLASGGYGELAGNLTLKVQEGLLVARPPLWDLLEIAHGPLQQIATRNITLLMLRRHDAPGEAELVERLRATLAPDRHRLVLLPATLPGAQALFEHETMLNEIVLEGIAHRRIDQAYRPDQPRDQPLYAVAEPVAAPEPPPRPTGAAVARLTWPELEALIAAGRRTAVLPLGATEQHGPHLPFATDTMIAEALAVRFCAAVDEAVRFPALPFGCSAEHRGFPGTVSLEAATLAALLGDAVRSIAPHGFDTVFIFSAHGGNAAALAAAVPALRQAAPALRIIAFTDLDAVVAAWHRAAAAAGIAAAAAGHHAGEIETSIVLGLDAEAVRRDRLAPGLTDVGGDAQAIFYPDLRRHAADGVVGDPRAAAAARALGYLDAWAALLVAHYRREKKAKNTPGTQNA